jgi:hypothetical protein
MKLEYVPLLRIQRDLHDIPHGLSPWAGLALALNDAQGERTP